MFHEVMAIYFKMTARRNHFRVIDIFPVIIYSQIKALKVSEVPHST